MQGFPRKLELFWRFVGADATADDVWRYPSHSSEDICVLEAIEPPAGYTGSAKQSLLSCVPFQPLSRPAGPLPLNTIRVPEFSSGRRRLGANRCHLSSNACWVSDSLSVLNTRGDLDGDENCWCPQLKTVCFEAVPIFWRQTHWSEVCSKRW